MTEKRRSDRYRAELQVDIVTRKGGRRVVTSDIGRHGIFLRTDDPPDERLLIQLRIHLPDGWISVLGVVVRRVLPAPGRNAGAGVQFFALSPDAKDRLEAHIATLRGDGPALPTHFPATGTMPDAVREPHREEGVGAAGFPGVRNDRNDRIAAIEDEIARLVARGIDAPRGSLFDRDSVPTSPGRASPCGSGPGTSPPGGRSPPTSER